MGRAVVVEGAQVFVDAEERRGPRPRAGETGDGGERGAEEIGGEPWPSAVVRAGDDGAERPDGAAVAVLRAAVLAEPPRIGHEVPETPERRIVRVAHEGQVPRRQLAHGLGLLAARVLHRGHEEQRARVVVEAVAVVVARHVVGTVLEKARVVRHVAEVLEIDLGEIDEPLHRGGSRRAHRRALRVVGVSVLEALDVAARDRRPQHPDPVGGRALAHRQALRVVTEETVHLARDRRRISPRHEDAAVVGQELARVAVGRGDHGPARADGGTRGSPTRSAPALR